MFAVNVLVGGNGGTGAPEAILVELERRFLAADSAFANCPGVWSALSPRRRAQEDKRRDSRRARPHAPALPAFAPHYGFFPLRFRAIGGNLGLGASSPDRSRFRLFLFFPHFYAGTLAHALIRNARRNLRARLPGRFGEIASTSRAQFARFEFVLNSQRFSRSAMCMSSTFCPSKRYWSVTLPRVSKPNEE